MLSWTVTKPETDPGLLALNQGSFHPSELPTELSILSRKLSPGRKRSLSLTASCSWLHGEDCHFYLELVFDTRALSITKIRMVNKVAK